jgi:L-ascorbate metabolism protein UlaG (beta-lactamase superfamily)
MRLTWLGWAGIELATDDATLVIDPLQDAAAVFAGFGPDATATLPEVVPAAAGQALAGLVTHLHRDHADAGALRAALADGAPVLEPEAAGGDDVENLALAQAEAELSQLERRRMRPWESTAIGGFRITALPAVDGIGDPQVSWLVEADGARVLHLGDTMFHGYWWRIARRLGPIHAEGYEVSGAYEPVADAVERFEAAATVPVVAPDLGITLEIDPA